MIENDELEYWAVPGIGVQVWCEATRHWAEMCQESVNALGPYRTEQEAMDVLEEWYDRETWSETEGDTLEPGPSLKDIEEFCAARRKWHKQEMEKDNA